MVVVSAGIRPRDELARACGLKVGERGGVVVDDRLRTSDPRHLRHRRGRPARRHDLRPRRPRLRDGRDRRRQPHRRATRTFAGADLSTKLKLMGVDVASFGDSVRRARAGHGRSSSKIRSAASTRSSLFNPDGTRLLGGVLVGDASDYGTLLAALPRATSRCPCPPGELLVGATRAAGSRRADWPTMPRSARATTSARRRSARRSASKSLTTLGEVKTCTKAGTGCGGCVPLRHRPAQGAS